MIPSLKFHLWSSENQIVRVRSRSRRTKSITKHRNVHCDWFILSLLLPTLTIWFSLDHKQNISDRDVRQHAKKVMSDSPGLVNFTVGLVNSALKVIPLFCTVHPLLRMTLRHPRWQRFFPLVWKEQARAAFTDLKLLFAIKCCRSADSFLVCYRKTRKWKKCAWSRSLQWFFTMRPSRCGISKLSWLRLWIMGVVKPVGQLYGSPTALSGLESLLCICCSNSKRGEMNISGTNKTHHSTRTMRGRPWDVNTKFAAEFTFCGIRSQTSEHMENRNQKSFLQVSLSSIIVQKQKHRTLAHQN